MYVIIMSGSSVRIWGGHGDREFSVARVAPAGTRRWLLQTADDLDGDGVLNADDNCPNVYNPGQQDVLDTEGQLSGENATGCEYPTPPFLSATTPHARPAAPWIPRSGSL